MTKKELENKLKLVEAELKEIKEPKRTEPIIMGYCRISTKKQLDQNGLEGQENEILSKYPNAVIYKEQVSGQSKEREVFNKIIEETIAGDILVCNKLDRFCRSTEEGLKDINKLLEKGVSIHILNMGLIDNSPVGKLMITVLLAFSEYEKSLILDRMNSGLEIAKQRKGFKLGRKEKYTVSQKKHAMNLLKENSYTQVEKMTGIPRSTLIYINKKFNENKKEIPTGLSKQSAERNEM